MVISMIMPATIVATNAISLLTDCKYMMITAKSNPITIIFAISIVNKG